METEINEKIIMLKTIMVMSESLELILRDILRSTFIAGEINQLTNSLKNGN